MCRHGILINGHRQNGAKRVLRGGSWISNGHRLRCAYRNNRHPDRRNHNNGLRLAIALFWPINQHYVLFQC